jgi:hypothetical protein
MSVTAGLIKAYTEKMRSMSSGFSVAELISDLKSTESPTRRAD